jgi:mannose-6-phosphate isomerase-like protein (cupin superfamily)
MTMALSSVEEIENNLPLGVSTQKKTLWVLAGECTGIIGTETLILKKGDSAEIPEGTLHSISLGQSAKILCFRFSN